MKKRLVLIPTKQSVQIYTVQIRNMKTSDLHTTKVSQTRGGERVRERIRE